MREVLTCNKRSGDVLFSIHDLLKTKGEKEMFRNNSNMPGGMDTIGLSAGVTPLSTNNSTNHHGANVALEHKGDFKMKTRITSTNSSNMGSRFGDGRIG